MDTRRWVKIITAYLSFLALAFCSGQLGPTLPELQRITDVDTAAISWLATGRSLGQLVGNLLGGVAVERLPRGSVSTTALFLAAPCITSVPFFSSVTPMIVIHVVYGFLAGSAIVGINMQIINTGGSNGGPILTALHLFYNVGLLLAPLVVAPFLEDKPGGGKGVSADLVINGDLDDILEDHGLSRIVIPYSIGGLLLVVMSVTNVVVLCATRTQTVENTNYQPLVNNENSQIYNQRNRMVIFTLVVIFFFFYCVFEINYTTFLATFAVDYLNWSDQQAVLLTSVFIFALTFGRFLAIFAVKFFSTSKVIWSGLILAVFGIIPLFFLEYEQKLVWVSSSILGLAIAPIYATNLTWTNENISLSARLGSVLIFGGGVGYVTGPFVQGLLSSQFGIVSLKYLCAAAVACAVLLRFSLFICTKKMPVNAQVVAPTAPPYYYDTENTPLLLSTEKKTVGF